MRAFQLAAPIGWRETLTRAGTAVYDGRCFARAASLAYYFFLALFPALLFVVSIATLFPVQHLIDRIVTILSRVAPGDVVAIARQQFAEIARRPHTGVLTLSLIAALWSTSSGMTAVSDTLNEAYHITESRPWWRVRAIAVALTMALTSVGLAAFALVMVGPSAVQHAADAIALGPVFEWTWNVARWPMAFALIVTAVGCIYHFAPDTTHEWVWITPGSVAAATIWLAVSLGFKWYVLYFAAYQKTYGAIGGVMIALLWFYFTSLALLLGAQLDATIDEPRGPSSDGTVH